MLGASSGQIASPGYTKGRDYLANSNCVWIIRGPPGKVRMYRQAERENALVVRVEYARHFRFKCLLNVVAASRLGKQFRLEMSVYFET